MGWIIALVYILVILGISFVLRRQRNIDDYLMAGRDAGTIKVAAGIFTLIGGGELVTMASLGYVYGYAGLSLFVGYSLGFFFLAGIVPKIRERTDKEKFVSLPDYVHSYFGVGSGTLVFIFSFLAFFSLLMLQFSTAGAVISPFVGLTYSEVVILIGLTVLGYLLIGGFKAVLITDVIQGVAIVILLPLLFYSVVADMVSDSQVSVSALKEQLPLAVLISFVFTGFFVATASADVWQRVYAAKGNSSAKSGLVIAGVLFLVVGWILVEIGQVAHSLGIQDPDSAFVITITTYLPDWAAILAILLVLSAVLSTSDTEMFLLTGMIEREAFWFPILGKEVRAFASSVLGARVIITLIALLSISMALVFTDLVGIYVWLLSALVVISPIITFSLFKKASPKGMLLSILANTFLFFFLVFTGLLTIDNIYLIAFPGILFYMLALVFGRDKSKVNTFE